MAHYKVLIITLLATLVTCEPPVQGYNYQAPTNNYNSGSNSYLPPSTGFTAPSNSYLPPTNFGNTYSSGSYSGSTGSFGSRSTGSFGSGSTGSFGSGSTGSFSGSSGSFGSGYSGNSYDHGSHGDGHDHGHDHGHGSDNEVPKSYEFGYAVKDAESGNDYDRRETSDGNVVRGEYRVQLPDGRTQIVTYHADWQTGFHADVKYEGEARYPEPTQNVHQQGGYNYNAPSSNDFQGSLTGFHGNRNSGYKPSTAYGPPGYH